MGKGRRENEGEKTRGGKRGRKNARGLGRDTTPFFPQAPARVLFSRSPCVRADPLSESLEQASSKLTAPQESSCLATFFLNGHTLVFHPQTQKSEPPCTA